MEPFIGQVQLFAFNFAPKGWMFCNGQLLSIAQNSALFSLLGTTYGGDGITTFALPNLQSRVPLGFGQGPGLSSYELGQAAGTEQVTLLSTQMPQHNHLMQVSRSQAGTNNPDGGVLAASNGTVDNLGEPVTVNTYASTPNAAANIQTIAMAGNNQPHPNMQPYLAMNYCIAIEGIYPSHS